jgi:ABC-type transport system involved in multi-copper enzyme maturation permease subunit
MRAKAGTFTAIVSSVVSDALHRKFYYVLVALTLLLVLMIPVLPSARVGVQIDLMREGFLGLVSLMSFLLAVIMAAAAISVELEKRMAYYILSKPISRWTYYTAKYAGVLLVVAATLVFSWVLVVAFIYLKFSVFNPGVYKALVAIFLESAVLAAFTLMLTTFASPVVSFFGTLVFYVVCHVKGDYLHDIMADAGRNVLARGFSGFFYYVLPNLGFFNINQTVAHGERAFPVSALDMLMLLILAAAFSGVFILIGGTVFRRKEI